MALTSNTPLNRRASRTHSTTSDTPYTPHTTPPPPPTRRGAASGTRAVRAHTIDSEPTDPPIQVRATHLPPHYFLPPTIPNPFTGTLEASLDAILAFSQLMPRTYGTRAVLSALSMSVSAHTHWPALLRDMYLGGATQGTSRLLVEEVLFLTTRTLLPEQIAENRGLLARLYERRKQLAIKLVLRYDMLREWRVDGRGHAVTIGSVAPGTLAPPALIPVRAEGARDMGRRGLMVNVVATLVAAPEGGWTTHAVRERMRHHVTALDGYLVLSDEEVAGWSDETVLSMTGQVVLQWQWLRQNNEILGEMEIGNWEELEGRADECEWIADDVRRGDWARGGGKRAAVDEGE